MTNIQLKQRMAQGTTFVDVYLRPPVQGYGLLDYAKREEMEADAYEHGVTPPHAQ